MTEEKLDADFASLPPAVRAEIEGRSGVGLHHAADTVEGEASGDAFRHPEQDAAGTQWAPNWEPIDTYPDGRVVMLDDGNRQMLGRRDMGLWMELAAGEEVAQPDYQPMLWAEAPDQVKFDLM